MQQALIRGLLAAVMGAIIGTLAAIQLEAFWILGTIGGGILAWISCDVKSFMQAIPLAFSHLHERKELLKSRFPAALLEAQALFYLSTTYAIAVSMLLLLPLLFVEPALIRDSEFVELPVIFGLLIGFLSSVGFIFGIMGLKNEESRYFVKTLNPLKVYLITLPKFIITQAPIALKFTYDATLLGCKRLFWLAHNHLRLCSLLGATTGSVIGFLAGGNVIISGLVGAMAFMTFTFATYLFPSIIQSPSPILITRE